ncbi:MAG TPA: ester cyclase [Candidatus Baltobacteraceae bacterium]|jgi:predicted ester cyclase|nr:ester cyclase [Candidatus Baltobacteraceae bacterium]
MHESNIEARISEFYEAWNRGDREHLMQAIASNAVDHNAETQTTGFETVFHALETIHAAFPDLHYTLHELAIDSRRQLAVVNVMCQGTFAAPYHDMAPTHRQVAWREMRMTRWHEGRVVEHWTVSELVQALVTQR